MSDVIDFKSRFGEKSKPAVEPGRFEFHMFPQSEVATEDEIIVAPEGYLKWGPAFIVIVDGLSDESQVLFAAAVGLVKYVKKLGPDDSVQGTLSL